MGFSSQKYWERAVFNIVLKLYSQAYFQKQLFQSEGIGTKKTNLWAPVSWTPREVGFERQNSLSTFHQDVKMAVRIKMHFKNTISQSKHVQKHTQAHIQVSEALQPTIKDLPEKFSEGHENWGHLHLRGTLSMPTTPSKWRSRSDGKSGLLGTQFVDHKNLKILITTVVTLPSKAHWQPLYPCSTDDEIRNHLWIPIHAFNNRTIVVKPLRLNSKVLQSQMWSSM